MASKKNSANEFEDICFDDKEIEEFSIEYKGKEYRFAKKQLSWAKVNKLVSEATEVSENGMKFNLDTYMKKSLLAILVQTPWDLEDTPLMLNRINKDFGDLLEKHAPKPGVVKEEMDFFVEN